MPLIDKVKAMYPENRLVSITNPNDRTATTIDEARLQVYCDHVIGMLDVLGVGTYSDDDDGLVAHAVRGVMAWAQSVMLLGDEGERLWSDWLDVCDKVAQTRRQDRIEPYAGEPKDRRRTPRFFYGRR